MLSRLSTYLPWVPVAVLFSDTIATVHVAPSLLSPSPSSPSSSNSKTNTKSLFLIRRVWRPSSIGHGHVVLVQPPHPSSPQLLRRVVGVGGDYILSRHPANQLHTYVPPGFLWLEDDHDHDHDLHLPSAKEKETCNGLVPSALVTGHVTNVLLPSPTPVPTIPSDRAFPSANRQLYFPPAPTATAPAPAPRLIPPIDSDSQRQLDSDCQPKSSTAIPTRSASVHSPPPPSHAAKKEH